MKLICTIFLLSFLSAFSASSFAAEHLTMQITNCVATSNEIQFDFLLLNDGTLPLKFNSASLRMNHSAAIIPAGTNTIQFSYVGGSEFPAAYVSIPSTYNVGYNAGSRLLQLTMSPGNYSSNTAIDIPVGGPAKKVGRFSLKIMNTDWVTGASAGLTYFTNGNGAVVYVNGSSISTAMSQTTTSIFALDPPCTLNIPTSCTITSAVSNIAAVSCFGGTDGGATVTLTNATAPVTWNLNGDTIPGNTTTINLSALSYGNNSVTYTDAGGCTGIANFSVGGPTAAMTIIGCTHTDALCNSGTGSVTAGTLVNPVGAVTYSWVDTTGSVLSVNPSVNLPPGEYTLTVTDNCSSTSCSQTIADVDSFATDYSSNSCVTYSLPWGTVVSLSGDYTHTFQSTAGCDSTVTAHVTILNETSSDFADTATDVYYLPWGDTALTSGDYTFTYTAVNGCDSIVTAHVVIEVGTGISDVSINPSSFYSVDRNSIFVSDKIRKSELFNNAGQKVGMKNLSEGTYFLRMLFHERVMTQKIIIRN